MSKTEKRWEKSQHRENEYYQKNRDAAWGIPYSLDYWLNFLALKDLPDKVLEVGCGPNGLWRFTDKVMGLDPIDFSGLGDNFIQGQCECIPAEPDAYDMVICINALDHMKDPCNAMREMMRVSRRVILWTNVYSPLTRWIITLLDEHPHHFTMTDIENLIKPGAVDHSIRVSFSRSHLKYTHNGALRLKLRLAEALGMHGQLYHIRRKT